MALTASLLKKMEDPNQTEGIIQQRKKDFYMHFARIESCPTMPGNKDEGNCEFDFNPNEIDELV